MSTRQKLVLIITLLAIGVVIANSNGAEWTELTQKERDTMYVAASDECCSAVDTFAPQCSQTKVECGDSVTTQSSCNNKDRRTECNEQQSVQGLVSGTATKGKKDGECGTYQKGNCHCNFNLLVCLDCADYGSWGDPQTCPGDVDESDDDDC